MTISIPSQSTKSVQEFLADSGESIAAGKLATIGLVIFQTVFTAGAAQLMSSLNFIGFMAVELGVSLQYPSVSLGFFGLLLGLINFDLLSEFE